MEAFEYRGFRLWRRTDDGRGVYCAIYRDERNQRRRLSLDTTDEAEARDCLVRLALERGRLRVEDAAQVTVGELVTRHYERKLKHLPSGEQAYHHARHLIDHLGHVKLAELNAEIFRGFMRAMRPRSNGYINRVLSDLRSAIRAAHDEGEIPIAPKVSELEKAPPRNRVLSIQEMAALLAAAEGEPFHARLFLVLAIGTASRPGALLGLRKEQCDFRLKLIDLNGGGREQTNKLRPVVPMVPTVERWLAVAPEPFVIQLAGRPLANIKSAFRRVRKRAGLGPEVIPYTLRHSVATHLRARGVPMDEIATFLGHSTGFRTTERYAKPMPQAGLGYLPRVREAVEGLLSDIGRVAARPVSTFNQSMAMG
jgi:integrase